MQIKKFFITSCLRYFHLLILFLCLAGCAGNGENKSEDNNKPSFAPVVGVDFYEVRRSFENGLAYDTLGFVQVPEWHIKFTHEDSVQIYTKNSDSLFNYAITHDHDSYFHFARESWKVVDLHPDSMMLQRLSLRGLKVDKIRSNVYMRFYSEAYIRNRLGTTVAELRKPPARDTLFIRERVARANRNPSHTDSAFASQNYVRLVSKNPMAEVKRRRLDSLELLEQSSAYEYLYPEYDIMINRAYKDFSHTFSVLVDQHGKMHLGKFMVMSDFEESRRKVLTGIMEVYLQNLLEINPATTLGMPHVSVVYLRVRGKKK